jgi:hypothetical protein
VAVPGAVEPVTLRVPATTTAAALKKELWEHHKVPAIKTLLCLPFTSNKYVRWLASRLSNFSCFVVAVAC